jgi:acyl-CoA reductase-like NAD-dependent aldehyde dehydrogenase
VGWDLKAKAGKKKVVLELGGNAAVVVDNDADLDDAVERIIFGAFYQSGQSCIGVQRIIIHADIYDDLRDRLVARAGKLIAGRSPRTRHLRRPDDQRRARHAGSTLGAGGGAGRRQLLCGGKREGRDAGGDPARECRPLDHLYREEAFGPVAILSKFTDFNARWPR